MLKNRTLFLLSDTLSEVIDDVSTLKRTGKPMIFQWHMGYEIIPDRFTIFVPKHFFSSIYLVVYRCSRNADCPSNSFCRGGWCTNKPSK